MKKIYMLFLAMICLGEANAQTEKGTYLLGGGAQFLTTDGSSIFSLSPNVGYFVANKWALGARASLATGDGFSSWNIGPFTRYYFGGKENASFFGQLGANIGGGKNSDTEFGLGVGAGYAVFLNESVALEFTAGYDKAGDNNGIFGLGVGFQIHLKK
jgi:hypothetical protein